MPQIRYHSTIKIHTNTDTLSDRCWCQNSDMESEHMAADPDGVPLSVPVHSPHLFQDQLYHLCPTPQKTSSITCLNDPWPLVFNPMKDTSSTLTSSTGAPQGYVLSLFLCSLSIHNSNSIIKFMDSTTVIGPVTKNNKMAYGDLAPHFMVRLWQSHPWPKWS